MKVVETLYSKKGHPFKEIQFWQFQEIIEAAHGVAHYKVIMKIVLAYLPFDDWGELSKQSFFEMLEESVLPMRGGGLKLLKSVLWNWL